MGVGQTEWIIWEYHVSQLSTYYTTLIFHIVYWWWGGRRVVWSINKIVHAIAIATDSSKLALPHAGYGFR